MYDDFSEVVGECSKASAGSNNSITPSPGLATYEHNYFLCIKIFWYGFVTLLFYTQLFCIFLTFTKL